MQATVWALIPPILAIVISLLTKEVNLSLFIGIMVGALLYCGGNLFQSISVFFEVMSNKVQGNMGVLIFVVLLGMIVHLMNCSGATHQYAQWASAKIKTKRQSLLATMLLGVLIFVDDYFNCLTVGTVMRPITDRNGISREKLAYIIDSTAAPICIIAPISSWAAAVSSSLPDGSSIDGFRLFIRTIFCNYYSWFSLTLILVTSLFAVDFGKMRVFEKQAEKRGQTVPTSQQREEPEKRGKVIDLALPVLSIIVFSFVSMLYTGGFFDGGLTIGEALANCDAITGLAIGTLLAVFFTALLYLPRRIVTPKQFVDGLVEGFKYMVPAILILILAWTLSGICGGDYLDIGSYVSGVVEKNHVMLSWMPAIFFLVALLLAFSTGTSWGTFAILLPITVSVFNDQMTSLMVMTTAAVLGGSVCGDHISPISDTTILSSTGADCSHINHVESQMQYGLIVAAVSFFAYLFAGAFDLQVWGLLLGILLLICFGLGLRVYYKKKEV